MMLVKILETGYRDDDLEMILKDKCIKKMIVRTLKSQAKVVMY